MYGGTYYYYEATSTINNINLSLSDTYNILSIVSVVLCALIAFALILFTAIATKRGIFATIYGVFTALVQPVGFVAAWQIVASYGRVDFSGLEMTVTSSISTEDAMSKLTEKMGEVMLSEIFPQLVWCILWIVVLAIVSIITLVYFILLIRGQKKVFPIVATVLLVVRHFCMSPLEILTIFLGISNEWIQFAWDTLFRGAMLAPFLLIALQGVFAIVTRVKEKRAAEKAALEEAQAALAELEANENADENGEAPAAAEVQAAEVFDQQ